MPKYAKKINLLSYFTILISSMDYSKQIGYYSIFRYHSQYYSQHLSIIFSLLVCLSGSYSQIIGPDRLNFSGFDGGHPGDIITKFSKDRFVY